MRMTPAEARPFFAEEPTGRNWFTTPVGEFRTLTHEEHEHRADDVLPYGVIFVVSRDGVLFDLHEDGTLKSQRRRMLTKEFMR